jgi:hypothetical protein
MPPVGLVQCLLQDKSGEKVAQVRLLLPGAETVLGDAGADAELFVTDDYTTLPLAGLPGACMVVVVAKRGERGGILMTAGTFHLALKFCLFHSLKPPHALPTTAGRRHARRQAPRPRVVGRPARQALRGGRRAAPRQRGGGRRGCACVWGGVGTGRGGAGAVRQMTIQICFHSTTWSVFGAPLLSTHRPLLLNPLISPPPSQQQ